MGWRTKAHALAVASRVPGGKAIYRRYQDRQASSMNDADEMLTRALDLLGLYRESGVSPAGRACLEIGTGWCPWVPLLLAISGAERIVTIDINPWLSLKTAAATTEALIERSARVGSALGVTQEAIVRRLAAARQATTLEAWLASLNMTYRCEDLLSAAFPAGQFDVIFSSNVLEHVPPAALEAIHRESFRLLRSGGHVVHRFNPQDHFSAGDRSITGSNFLRFSEEDWRWLGGSGLSYHNRLRCPQHRDLIAHQGFGVVVDRRRADPAARRAVETGALKVHQDYAAFNAAELTDDYMWIVAEKTAVPARTSAPVKAARPRPITTEEVHA